jgi:hypothetical protein
MCALLQFFKYSDTFECFWIVKQVCTCYIIVKYITSKIMTSYDLPLLDYELVTLHPKDIAQCGAELW